jgi:hypothetical protein
MQAVRNTKYVHIIFIAAPPSRMSHVVPAIMRYFLIVKSVPEGSREPYSMEGSVREPPANFLQRKEACGMLP